MKIVSTLKQHLPRLAILGRGRCGKDTAGDFLKAYYNLKFEGGCSWAGKEYVAERLGISVKEAWETRHQRRMEWYNLLNEYRKDDWARLVRRVFETSDFVCGIRDGEELKAAKAEGLIDLAIWVERAQAPYDPTLCYGPEDCDIIITNHTTLHDYFLKLDRLAKSLGFPKLNTQPVFNYDAEKAAYEREEALKAKLYNDYCKAVLAERLKARGFEKTPGELELSVRGISSFTAPGC